MNWYHQTCVGFVGNDLPNSSQNWECTFCSSLQKAATEIVCVDDDIATTMSDNSDVTKPSRSSAAVAVKDDVQDTSNIFHEENVYQIETGTVTVFTI